MKLEHFGMPEPGDCRVVFSASAEELEAAVQAEQAAPDAPKEEEDLLTAAVNRAILEGFSPLFAQLMEEHRLVPVTDPDFELLAVNRAEGFRAGAEFFCLPPLFQQQLYDVLIILLRHTFRFRKIVCHFLRQFHELFQALMFLTCFSVIPQ